MTNHMLKICHRGFQNETTYVSVSDAEFAEADAYLDTLVDDVNDTSCWLDAAVRLAGIARSCVITWQKYKAEWIEPYR